MMTAVTICSDFGAPKNKVWHCFHCFLIYSHEGTKVVADEKQTISESAIENEDDEISSQLETDDEEERSEE